MIQLPPTRFWKCCAPENAHKPRIEQPWFFPNRTLQRYGTLLDTPDMGTVAATNGFVLVIFNVSHEIEDCEGPLPIAALEAAMKARPKEQAFTSIHAKYPGAVRVKTSIFQRYIGEGEPYSYIALEGLSKMLGQPHSPLTGIALDMTYLLQVTEAFTPRNYRGNKVKQISSGHIALVHDSARPNAAAWVFPRPDSEWPIAGFALQMPVRGWNYALPKFTLEEKE